MNKRGIALLLILAMCFCFGGCKKSDDSGDIDSSKAVTVKIANEVQNRILFRLQPWKSLLDGAMNTILN